jgi:hypothetical protein
VAAEIVHDHNVAGPENWHKLLFDISSKALAVDRPVEDARGDEAVTAQSAQCAFKIRAHIKRFERIRNSWLEGERRAAP